MNKSIFPFIPAFLVLLFASEFASANDGGHCADDEPEDFVVWIGIVTGYSGQ